MKKLFYVLTFLFSISFFVISCEKEEDNIEEKLPAVTTFDVENIAQTSVTAGGKITNDKGFEIINKGICWSNEPHPDIESNLISSATESDEFYITITGLNYETNYYLRAYATNAYGTSYGTLKSFQTLKYCPETVEDWDGNIYQTTFIGNQCWMAENLKTTKYNDGNEIIHEINFQSWTNTISGAYCWYSNDYSTYGDSFGILYNGYTVLTKKICPENWRVPTIQDISELTEYLGGVSIAGGKLKDTGTDYWHSPNNGASNETGFTARGGGYRHGSFGNFDALKHNGYWWTSTPSEENEDVMKAFEMNKNTTAIYTPEFNKNYGVSIRCILD